MVKNLGKFTIICIFFKFWNKARVYYTLSISKEGRVADPRAPISGFAAAIDKHVCVTVSCKHRHMFMYNRKIFIKIMTNQARAQGAWPHPP